MNLNDRIKLLGQYLRGKTSGHQNRLIDEWYHAVDDSQEIGLWQEQGKKETVRDGIRLSVWEHILKRPRRRGMLSSMQPVSRWVAAAGIIAVLLTACWLLMPVLRRNSVQYFTVTASLGEIRQVWLPDSSRVWLKSGSTLRYNSTYGKQSRDLELVEGEAFFSVHKDRRHPFIVSTGQLQAKVLGTAFNVQAYANRPAIQIWVEHGRVAVSNRQQVLQELTQGKRLQWDRLDGNVRIDSLAWGQALAWHQGILLLESASFTELAFQLKELYGVELATSDATIRSLHYDAKFFIQTPVEDIVATLAAVHGIQFKRQGEIITLY